MTGYWGKGGIGCSEVTRRGQVSEVRWEMTIMRVHKEVKILGKSGKWQY
jgi:hypothetical protein